ncbi:hypothetical protein [Paenibacillus sp. 1P07SE]|uniref:hypothetical protein n=1 Tax=Paenibacillus sp. 1P07SE TaxID=3132209 RepID=UPI0039A47AA2
MRKGIWILMVAVVGLLLTSCSGNAPLSNTPGVQQPEAQGDWPLYSIEQMLNGKTDLIVLALVDSVTKGKEPQIAELHIEETFYGEAPDSVIELYQTTRHVQPGQKYLLFLSYREQIGQYVVSDGLSQVEYNNDKLEVRVEGIQGDYTVEQFRKVMEGQT